MHSHPPEPVLLTSSADKHKASLVRKLFITLETTESGLQHPQKILHRKIEKPDTSLTSWVIWDNLCLQISVQTVSCVMSKKETVLPFTGF